MLFSTLPNNHAIPKSHLDEWWLEQSLCRIPNNVSSIFENMRIWVQIFNIFQILKKKNNIFFFVRTGIWHRERYIRAHLNNMRVFNSLIMRTYSISPWKCKKTFSNNLTRRTFHTGLIGGHNWIFSTWEADPAAKALIKRWILILEHWIGEKQAGNLQLYV